VWQQKKKQYRLPHPSPKFNINTVRYFM
jgi:hypothetical protein